MRILAAAGLALAVSTGAAMAEGLKDYSHAPIWTGAYVGAHIGYGWADGEHAQTNGGMPYGPYRADDNGVIGGFTLGYNLQAGPAVFSIEAEGGYMDISGQGRIPSSSPGHYQAIDADAGWYGLIAGRLGIAFDRTLFYGKGGYSWINGDAGQQTTKPGFITHRSGSFHGFVYGAGIEHILSERISLKIEWLHFGLDTVRGDQTSVTDDPIGYVYTNKTDVDIDTVKLGINLKF